MWDCHRKFSENKINYSNLTSTIIYFGALFWNFAINIALLWWK